MADSTSRRPSAIFSIADQNRPDLFPCRISLKEGLSEVGKAVLMLLSEKTLLDPKQLKSFLDQSARIDFFDGEQNRIRSFPGKITEVTHLGYVGHTGSADRPVFAYEFTVESSLANLRFSRQTRSFLKKTLKNVLEEVLDSCGYSPKFKGDMPSAELDFYQKDETDLDFFLRLLYDNGLCFQTSDTQKEFIQILREPALAEPAVTECNMKYSGKDDGSFRDLLTAWRMIDRIGIDDAGSGSDIDERKKQKRFVELNRLHFPLLPEDTPNSICEKINDAAKNVLKSARCGKTRREGKTTSPRLVPGTQIHIEGFFGSVPPKGCANRIDARVISMKTEMVQEIPGTFHTLFMERPEMKNSVEFSALELSASEVLVTRPPASRNDSVVYRAVVCDAEGKTDKNNETTPPEDGKMGAAMFFYALPYGMRKPVRVEFSMPLGGSGQGLFHFPRIGDNVLVAAVEGSFILTSYLPGNGTTAYSGGKDAPDTSGLYRNSTSLRHNTPGKSADYRSAGPPKPVDGTAKDGIKFCEFGMYSGKQFADPDNATDDAVRIASTGDLFEQSNGDSIHTAGNYTFSSHSSGQVLYTKIKKFIVEAEGGITLTVGGCSLSITPSGIKIKAQGLPNAGGPLDSIFSVDPIGGISSSALMQSHIGMTSISMGDSLGASIGTKLGAASVSGVTVKTSTISNKDFIFSKIRLGYSVAAHVTNFGLAKQPQLVKDSVKFIDHTPPPSQTDPAWIMGLFYIAIPFIMQQCDFIHARVTATKPYPKTFILLDIFKYATLSMKVTEYVKGPYNENERKALWIGTYVNQLMIMLSASVEFYKDLSKASNSVALSGDKLELNAKTVSSETESFTVKQKKKMPKAVKRKMAWDGKPNSLMNAIAQWVPDTTKAVAEDAAGLLEINTIETTVTITVTNKNFKLETPDGAVLVKSKKSKLDAAKNTEVKSGRMIRLESGETKMLLDSNRFKLNSAQILENAKMSWTVKANVSKINGKLFQLQADLADINAKMEKH